MAGDAHGTETQEEPQTPKDNECEQAAQDQPQMSGTDWEKAVANRDEKIAVLEAQVAGAAKNAETAEQLRGEIAELKAQGESDRIDFKLQLAGVRNVKAVRAILSDHGGDVDALKEAEPWLFADAPAKQQGGKTRLPQRRHQHGHRQDHEALAKARWPGRFQRQSMGGLRHGQQHRVRKELHWHFGRGLQEGGGVALPEQRRVHGARAATQRRSSSPRSP